MPDESTPEAAPDLVSRYFEGDNTYYYFFDPMGNVSEYTAEVEQITDDAAWTPKANPPKTSTPVRKRRLVERLVATDSPRHSR